MDGEKGRDMKNLMVGFALILTLVCGAILIQKNRELEKARAQLASAERQKDAAVAEAARKGKRSQELQTRLHESQAESLGKTSEAQELQQQLAKAGTKTNGAAGLSELFHNQAMKEALKAEAKVGVAKNVKTLFDAGVAEQLHLTGEQSEALKQLLTHKASILWEQMLVPMTTGELDEKGMAEAGKGIKQALEANVAQTKALLGDAGYNAYQAFEKVQPERERLMQFNSEAAKAGLSLDSDQQGRLFDAMVAERANFQFQYDLGDPLKFDFEHWNDNFSDEKIAAFNKDMEQLNERIVQRAGTLLRPDQVEVLKNSLNRELLHSMVTIQTTKSMMTANAR
jgi:hypothetical protein